MFRNTPVQRKLTLILLTVSGAALLLTCVAFFAYELFSSRRTTTRQLATVAEIVATNSTAALAFENQADAAEILAALAAEPQIVAAALYDREGKLFSVYPRAASPAELPPAPGPAGFRFEKASLHGFLSVAEGGKPLGTLYLRSDLRDMQQRFWVYGGIAALVLAVALLVAFLISHGMQAQISRPILALAETAHAVTSRRDYSVRAVKYSSDELGDLTDAFNQMLAQIEQLNRELESRVIERTAQLETANRELEAFSYSVSHDLRAPLRHIDGFVNLLNKEYSGRLDDQAQRYLRVISGAARQMGRLIDDLLAFSRTGRAPLKIGEVDHDAVVANAMREGRFDQGPKPIKWKIAHLPRVQADAPMLGQVWANLIGNAVKYTSKSESPEIEIGVREPAADAREHVFFIRDNGVGFDMAYAAKLFGVFQRLHSSDQFEGTGIGLANVQRIVARHGGRVWAEGAVGRGATFYFTLPIVATPTTRPPFPGAPEERRPGPAASTALTPAG